MRNDDSENSNEQMHRLDHQLAEAVTSMSDCASKAAGRRVREYIPPSNDIEAGIADILAKLLNVERVGANDNLILIGGESLLAAQAAWKIRERFGCEVSLRSILTGTVTEIAAEVLAATIEAPELK